MFHPLCTATDLKDKYWSIRLAKLRELFDGNDFSDDDFEEEGNDDESEGKIEDYDSVEDSEDEPDGDISDK